MGRRVPKLGEVGRTLAPAGRIAYLTACDLPIAPGGRVVGQGEQPLERLGIAPMGRLVMGWVTILLIGIAPGGRAAGQ